MLLLQPSEELVKLAQWIGSNEKNLSIRKEATRYILIQSNMDTTDFLLVGE
jgi:hypothetical protein